MDQRIINLYDEFTHGGMSRRAFFDRLVTLVGSSAAASALLPLLQCDYSKAETVAENDPRLAIDRVSYDALSTKIGGYLARAADKVKRPGIVIIHQNRGLNPHITDVARRYALEGYLAFAPDLLSVSGGTPGDDDKARELHQRSDREAMIGAAVAAVPFLLKHAECNGKVGAVGFCFGGGVINRMAAALPELSAAVVYYGVQIPAEAVPNIKAPLLLHYAENDENVNKGIPAYEAALKANHKRYTIYHYPGTQHAFSDDTAGARYNKEATELAWTRTIAFLRETLGAPPKVT